MASLADRFVEAEHGQAGDLRALLKGARLRVAAWLAPPVVAMPDPLPLKNSTQISLGASATFRPSDFGGDGYDLTFAKTDASKKCADAEPKEAKHEPLHVVSGQDMHAPIKAMMDEGWRLVSIDPTIERPITATGRVRTYVSFKPRKIILDELVSATFGGVGVPDKTICVSVEDAGDLLLTAAYVGNYNCFPTAPSLETGISGRAFSATALGGIDWPAANAGIDIVAQFAIKKSVIWRAQLGCNKCASDGYDPTPKRITVEITMNLFGEELR